MIKSHRAVRILIFISLMCFFAVCEATNSSNSIHHGYVLSATEQTVIISLLKGDASVFVEGGDSMMGKELLKTTAKKISSAYDENQVAADQKYFKKKVFLTGNIQSINSGVANKPYVTLVGIDQFISPQLRFLAGNLQKISMLRKGQKVSVVCWAGGAVVGVPMFTHCQFSDDYANLSIVQASADLFKFLQGAKPVSNELEMLAIAGITLAGNLPDASACRGEKVKFDNEKCNGDVMALIKNHRLTIKNEMHSVSEKLKLLGVRVSSPKVGKANVKVE